MSAEIKTYDSRMLKTIEVVKANFASVRAGRANAGVLDRISVEYYGTPTPLNQVAAISSPDPRTLMIQPWDASLLKAIDCLDVKLNYHLGMKSISEWSLEQLLEICVRAAGNHRLLGADICGGLSPEKGGTTGTEALNRSTTAALESCLRPLLSKYENND